MLNIRLLDTLPSSPIRPNPDFPHASRYLVKPLVRGRLLNRAQNPWQLDVDACVEPLREGFRALFENAGLEPLRASTALRARAPGEREERRLRELLDGYQSRGSGG